MTNSGALTGILLMLLSITVSGFSQVILKKAAGRTYASPIAQYLNVPVVSAYALFVLSTVFSALAYRTLPLSATPVFNALSQLIVAVLAFLFFREKPSRRRAAGLAVVIAGIVLFSL